jgi:RHS repeat-associated protein
MRYTLGPSNAVGRWASNGLALVDSSRHLLGVGASRLSRAIRASRLYRAAMANRLSKAISVLLTVAILVSALYPVLQLATPHARASSSSRANVSQASALTRSAVAATPVDVCQLYPIALHTATLAGVAVGGTIPNIYNGTDPGNFGWLSWTGDVSEPTLVTSLTPPGDSTTYINPNDPNDHVLVVGDSVDGRPGVSNSKGVRDALTQLESQDIVVPVWDQAQGQGSNNLYHVVGFAQVRIIGFQLPGANTISARYLGSTDCLGIPPPPPPPPPAPFNGATLTLSPATAGPNVTGTTQPLQAALTSRTGTAISGVSVQLTVTGANPMTPTPQTTDSNGLVSFSYVGATHGTDTAQATATDSSGAQLQSNTATIYWLTPIQTASSTTLWGRFFYADGSGVFNTPPGTPPVFTQAFPTIDFNPPGGTIPGNTSGVTEFSRPMQDVTTDLNGNFSGTIVVQGYDTQGQLHQAGTGTMFFFNAAFTGAFTVAAAGQVTFNFFTDDGFVLGVGSDSAGDAATRVGGANTNPPASGKTAFATLPVMGAYNVATAPTGSIVTVNFPAAGTYPYEVDYSEGICCQLVVTATTVTASGTQGVPPTGSLVLSPNTVPAQVAGGQQTFTLLATDAGGAPQANLPVELTIVGANAQRLNATTDSTGHATFTYTGTYAGTDTVQAVAWISGLASYSGQVTAQWTTPPTPPPVPQTVTQGWIGSPTSQTSVSGQVPITLAAGISLQSGTVAYWPASNPSAVTTLASNVSGGGGATLATLDTTMLADGTYIVQLLGTNSGGSQLNSEVLVTVVGQNKPGRVTFSVTDLTVPVSGMPITVGRTYDSLLRNQVGDFGNGWSLAIGHPQLTTDPAHDVTLTMPGGRRVTFAFTPQSTGGLFGFLLTPGYTPEAGVYGSLTSDGCGLLVVSGGQYVCFLDAQYAPTKYKYTDPYGRVYTLGADGSLQTIMDLNGNELVFGSTGITSAAGNSVSFARDGQGRITEISDKAGDVYQYGYDTNGNLASFLPPGLPASATPATYTYDPSHLLLGGTDLNGHPAATVTYDTSGRLQSVTDAVGNKTTYSYDLTNNTTTITAQDGGMTTLKYDSYGMVTSRTDPLMRTTTYTYDANHNLLSQTDPLLHTTSYTYDSQGNRTSTTDGLTRTSSVKYNLFGGPMTLTDPSNTTWTVVYDANSLPTSVSDSLGTRAGYTWDSHGNPLTRTDGNGNATTFTYDAFGNVLSQTDALTHSVSYMYDQLGRKITSKDANQNTTTYSYDALGHLLSVSAPVTQGQTHVTTYTYDANGNRLSMTDVNQHTTTYTYDRANRLTQVTYPDLTTTQYTYDFRGNVLTEKDQAGHVTQYGYDPAGQLTSVTTAFGTADFATTTYGYDTAGRKITQIDPDRNSTAYAYDKAGELLSVTDPYGHSTSYKYDTDGRQASTTDGNGHTTGYTYDIRGRLVTTTYQDTTTTQQSFDGAGNVLTRTDQAGNKTIYGYDPVNRLASVQDPVQQTLQQMTKYAYDANGNLLTITDANGHTTSFIYDALNRQTKKIWPDTSFELFGYDPVGNQTSHQLADGHTNTYQYDNMDRLQKTSYFDGTSVSYTYSQTGQPQTVIDGRGTTTYGYDNQDRVIQIAVPDGQSITYGYDAAGNRTGMVTAVGTVTATSATYTYDQDNRLATVNGTNVGTIGFAYDNAGNPTQRTLPNGITVSYGYDTLNRLTSVSEQQGTTTLASYTYTLDTVGNRTKVVEADGSASIWTYDQNSRLLGEARFDPSGAETAQASYTYDGVGNRLTQSSGGQTTTYSYNSLDQLTSTSGALSLQLSYDGRGNLITATSGTSSTSYTYDAADRLTGATLPGGTSVSYGYDAAGRQVSQTTGGSTTNSLWDEQSGYGDVALETDGTGAVQASYTLGGSQLLAQTRGSTTSYMLPDGQGSVRALASSAGTLTDTYRYDAYGTLVSSQGTTTNPYRYDSQRLDALTNLYQLRARSYDPTTGRFVSRDTAGVDLSSPVELNRYSYAGDNPITMMDPSGRTLAEDAAIRIPQQALPKWLVPVGIALAALFLYILLQLLVAALPRAVPWPDPTPPPSPCVATGPEDTYTGKNPIGLPEYAIVRGPEIHATGICHVNVQVTPPNTLAYNLHITYAGGIFQQNGVPIEPPGGTPCGNDPTCAAWVVADQQAKVFVSLTKGENEGNMILWFFSAIEPRLIALKAIGP